MPRRRNAHHGGAVRVAGAVAACAVAASAVLWWAAGVSSRVVAARERAGLSATGRATVQGEEDTWHAALTVIAAAARQPRLVSAVRAASTVRPEADEQGTRPEADGRVTRPEADGRAAAAARSALGVLRRSAPVGAVGVELPSGRLLATVGTDLQVLRRAATTPPGAVGIGPVLVVGGRPLRTVRVPIRSGAGTEGQLVVVLDLPQLLATTRFGRTGQQALVTTSGIVVAGPAALVGRPLRTPRNRALAARGTAATLALYSLYTRRWQLESYQPIPEQGLGVLTVQGRTEVMAGADALAGRLHDVALLILLAGLAGAGAVGTVLDRRDRGLRAEERALAEAEDALVAVRARAAALIEHGSDLITVADADGTVTFASPACTRLLGWPVDELVGASFLRLVHPDDRDRVDRLHRHLLERPGEAVGYECRMRHLDGRWRQMEVVRANHLDDPTIGGIVATKRDVTERVEVAELLAHRATHDELTGLPNRALLLDRLRLAAARAARRSEPCALLFLDLDRFKTINDTLGHAAGDELLRVVAGRLREAVRPEDTVARIGGDEFVVLAERIGDGEAEEIAERVRAAIDQPVAAGGSEVEVSCSVGITVSDHAGPEAMLQEADLALYRAKDRGRNRFERFDQALRTVARRSLDTEAELRRAIAAGDVAAHYQPIVALADRSPQGLEALVRLRQPAGGLLLPADFIDVAEESGLIVPRGTEVLAQACHFAAG